MKSRGRRDAGDPTLCARRNTLVHPEHLWFDEVAIMDPALAGYRALPLSRFEDLWCRVHNEGLVIGAKLTP